MKRFLPVKIAIILTICFVFVQCTVVVLGLNSDVYGRFDGPGPDISWVTGDYARDEFRFYSGKNRLQGFIYGNAVAAPKGLVVISPGIYSFADEYDKMIRNLVDAQWRVFSYNGTGVGGSEGNSMRGLSQGVVDLDAALTYIKNTSDFNGLPVMLLGYSWGGYSVCAVLNYKHNVKAVVSLAGFNSTQEAIKNQVVEKVGFLYYLIFPNQWSLEKQIFGDIAYFTAVDGLNKSQVSALIVLCSDDEIIPAHTISIYANRKNIKNEKAQYLYLQGEEAHGHYFKYYPPEKDLYTKVINFLNDSLAD